MCVSLLNTAMSTGQMIETGGNIQAGAAGVRALGDLAAGVTRARMSRADARAEVAYGEAKAGRIRKAGERDLGQSRAAAAASGVKLSSGSVLEAERSLVQGVEQDALSAILTGHNRADSLNRSAKFYQAAGINSAADSLLSGVVNWKRTRRTPEVDMGDASYDRLERRRLGVD